MARGRNSNHGGGGGALLACDRAIDRENEYKNNVKKVQVRAKLIAELLRPDSQLASVLADCDDGADDWLLHNRNRLKAIGEGNAKRMYEVDNFVEAMKEVRTEVQSKQNQRSGEEDGDDAADAPDYEQSINEAVDKIREQHENDPSRLEPVDHEMSTEIREALGEKVQKKRARASRGGDDEEDDLEIVHNQKDDVHSLKCPITGMLFNNPVKNKVCHHTYDKAGLAQLLKARKTTCPIPGCTNNGLNQGQVEEDEEMKLKVKRHKAREEAQKRQRDLEEDDDDEQGGGYTVL